MAVPRPPSTAPYAGPTFRRTRWYRRSDAPRTVFLYLCFTAFAIWVLAPIAFTVQSSFATPGSMTAQPPNWIPTQITFDNYGSVFNSATDKSGQYTSEQGGRMWSALFNSFFVGIMVAFTNLVIGGLAGYSYSRYRFRGSRAGFLFLLATRVVPGIALVVPFYALFRTVGLINTPWALIIAYNIFTLPLSIWLLKSYFDHLPREIEEAASVDGASRLRTLVVIVAPLARPGLVATGLLVFLESWSEFFFAVVLTNQLTVPPLLAGYQSLQTFTWNTLAAATVVSLIPPIVLAVVFQRYIVSGLSAGSVK
jgi:multiple sugar transport system permease protein/trehalose/maltose transport system permease protein